MQTYLYVQYILIYLVKSTNVECVYKFDTEGHITLCYINYIYADQGIGRKFILYNFTEFY